MKVPLQWVVGGAQQRIPTRMAPVRVTVVGIREGRRWVVRCEERGKKA